MPAKSREPGVTTEDVAAVIAPGVVAEESAPRPYVLSEGIREELARLGTSTDPNTGDRLDRNPDTGTITVTDRDGNTREL